MVVDSAGNYILTPWQYRDLERLVIYENFLLDLGRLFNDLGAATPELLLELRHEYQAAVRLLHADLAELNFALQEAANGNLG